MNWPKTHAKYFRKLSHRQMSMPNVRCQISRPVDSERGPFAGFAIEVGPAPGLQRWRSGDWPASTALWRIPRGEARRADFPDMKRKVDYGREPDFAALPTKIVCQTNRPAQVAASERADLFGAGHPNRCGRTWRPPLPSARRGPRRRRSSTPGRSRWTRSHLPPESVFPRARRGRSLPRCGEPTFRTPPRHRAPSRRPGRILIPGDGAAGDQEAQTRPACQPACPAMAATRRLRAVPSQRLPGAMISGAPAVL